MQVHRHKEGQDHPKLLLTRISTVLILTFVVTCVVMHVVQPSLSPVDDAVSFYLNGRLGWLFGGGIVAMGAGSLLLMLQVRRSAAARISRAGLILLGMWAIGCIVAGVFPPDAPGHWDQPPSTSGAIHGVAAMLLFLSFPMAAMLLSTSGMVFGGRPPLKTIAVLCGLATVTFFICLAPVFQNRPPYALGFVERVVLGLNVWWLLAASRRGYQR